MRWEASACLHILQASGGDSQRVQPQLHSVEQIQGVFVWHWWPTNLDTLSQGWMCLFMIPLHFCMMWSCLKLFEMSGRDRRNKLSLSQNHSAPQLHSKYSKNPKTRPAIWGRSKKHLLTHPREAANFARLKRCLCSTARRWRADHVGSCCVWRFLVSYPSQLIFTGSPVLTRCGSTRAMVTLVKVTTGAWLFVFGQAIIA